MATNRGGRLDFGCSSANGILLFREISKIVVEYGGKIADVTPPKSARYSCKLKGIRKRSVQFADADDIVDDSVLFNEIENTDMEINRLG